MIDDIRLKVCGLTSLADAELANRCGADYFGFILYPKSPRFISLSQYRAIAPQLAKRVKVAVSVEPAIEELTAMKEAGFDFFQIHFRPELPDAQLTAWSRLVGKDRLWLAPKLPPGMDVSAATRAAAKYVMLDTFQAEGFGGSGKTGDWTKFARHQAGHVSNIWILAGGLTPENIGDALSGSGARFVDVSSGVEASPGKKDEAKLKAFVAAVHAGRAR